MYVKNSIALAVWQVFGSHSFSSLMYLTYVICLYISWIFVQWRFSISYWESLVQLLLFRLRSMGQGTAFSIVCSFSCTFISSASFWALLLLKFSLSLQILVPFSHPFRNFGFFFKFGCYWGFIQLRCPNCQLIMCLECWRVFWFGLFFQFALFVPFFGYSFLDMHH